MCPSTPHTRPHPSPTVAAHLRSAHRARCAGNCSGVGPPPSLRPPPRRGRAPAPLTRGRRSPAVGTQGALRGKMLGGWPSPPSLPLGAAPLHRSRAVHPHLRSAHKARCAGKCSGVGPPPLSAPRRRTRRALRGNMLGGWPSPSRSRIMPRVARERARGSALTRTARQPPSRPLLGRGAAVLVAASCSRPEARECARSARGPGPATRKHAARDRVV